MTATSAPWATDRGTRLRYLPGLDGLRALAVVAVLAYHGGLATFGGGFLGVEVFLVISGYLITSLLLAEREATGTVQLGAFWWRRARRLLPAVLVLLGVVSLVSVVFLPGEVAGLRGDVVSSLFYVQNWHQIFAEQSYFEAVGRPPLLRHLWSLAVEEQFYLFWPIVFAAGIRFLGRRRLLVGVLAGAVGSLLLMALLFDPGGDPTRIYYGTDTRASGLLVGVALAMVWPPWRMRAGVGARASAVLDGVGAAALVALLLAMMGFAERSPLLYRGGFGLVDLATAAVIVVVAHPAARLGTVLGVAPLRWVGLRSYGIYLWHWPVFVLTRPGVDVDWPGWAVTFVRRGLTLALAELSYRYVEMPVRTGALARWWATVRAERGAPADARRQRVAVGGVVGIVVVLVVGVAMVRAEPEAPPWFVGEVSAPAVQYSGALALLPTPVAAAVSSPTAETDGAGGSEAAGGSGVPGADGGAAQEDGTAAEAAPPGPALVAGRRTLLGDSVMLGAVDVLGVGLGGEVVADAAVSRQVGEGIGLLWLWRDLGYLGDTVVIHLGNNGVLSDEQFDEMMAAVAGVPNVLVVNTRNPYDWVTEVNDTLARGVTRHPGVTLVDWFAASDPNPGWFWDDGMHLRPEGAMAYADVVARALSPAPATGGP